MAITKTIQATVKNRTDTAANWTQKNPVLAEGEIIVVQTSAGETRLKIGDGVKTFTQLPYTDEQIYNNVVTSVNGETGDVTLPGDFVINATPTDDTNYTLDKTFAQIQEAVQAGKNVYAQINESIPIRMQLVFYNSNGFFFGAAATTYNNIELYYLGVTDSQAKFLYKSAPAYNDDGYMPQMTIESAPTADMQIATKKYVDDHAGGGTDMGITGATVGQIAKITAVDASGVPTEWGPVDMPSGGASDFIIAGTHTETMGLSLIKRLTKFRKQLVVANYRLSNLRQKGLL